MTEHRKTYMKRYLADYYVRHTDTIKARAKRFYWDNAPRILAEQKVAYRAAHPKKVPRTKAERLAYLREYKRTHPLYTQAYVLRRRARLHGVHCERITQADLRALFAQFINCPYCGIELSPDNRVIDHKEPLSRGGAHTLDNIVPCCGPCNNRKSGLPYRRWLERSKGGGSYTN